VLALAASSLFAQGGGGAGFGGARGSGGAVVAREHPTVPVQTVRALIAAHHADIANGTSDSNILTLMIDSNGNYVGSAASKMNIVARAVAPHGDTVAAVASGSGARGGGGFITAAPASPVASVSPSSATGGAEPLKMTFDGIGTVDANLVQSMFFMTYDAGEVAPNALRVRFVILKAGIPK